MSLTIFEHTLCRILKIETPQSDLNVMIIDNLIFVPF